jgi:transcriptional regulator with XRE-family HTH domain
VSPDEGRPVGDVLREARHAAGLTQVEVARALGVAQTSVSALERGLYAPDEATWGRLADLYAVEPRKAETVLARIRTSHRLRGAAADTDPAADWPVDPAACSRPGWVGSLRARYDLTRAQLAARLAVPPGSITALEQADRPLPTAAKSPTVLRRLAALGDTDEAALRTAWQPDEIRGLEHLVGRDGEALVRAVDTGVDLIRWLLVVGWTQAEVAAACGVSRPAVSQWLSGRTTPAAGKLTGLADVLGVDEASLAHLG